MKIFLREKFLIAFLILILIPLVTISFFSYFNASKFLMESIKDYNVLLVRSMAIEVEDMVLEYKDLSQSILDDVILSKTIEGKKEILLESREKYIHDIKFLSILDKTGKEIVRSDNRELEDKKEYPEFYQIKENEKGYHITWLDFNPVVNMSTIIISVPFFEEDEFQGALICEVFLSDIWSKMVAGYTSPKDNIYLLTEQGQPVAEILATLEESRSDDLEKIAKELAKEKAVIVQEIDTEIGQMLIVADSIPMFGWELVIFRQISEIYKPTLILESNLALITFIILIFIFIISIYFSQLIVSPIKKLHSGMEIIRKGNLDYRVDIRTNDEIEDLGTAFNQMTEELERYHSASEESKAILQIKVKARTKELEELAEGLDNKVKDRTKRLEERLSELEKFHKLTVGREIKMIKLKKEIQKLKNREIK